MSNFGLALSNETALPSPPVTMQAAFRQALSALVDSRGEAATAIAERAGISDATMSRLKKGSRKPSLDMLETLRSAFDVEPAVLFTPRYTDVDGRIVDTSAPTRHTSVALPTGDPVGSPLLLEGGATVHEDQGLWSDIRACFDAMAPDDRAELWKVARRLKDKGGSQAGFGRR